MLKQNRRFVVQLPLVDVKHPDERVCTTSLEKNHEIPRRGRRRGAALLYARGRDARLRRRWRASHPRDRDRLRHDYSRRGDAGAAPRAAPSPPRARVPDPGLAPRASRKPRWAATVTGLVAPAFATLLLLGAALAAAGTSPFAKRRARRRGGRLPSRARRRSCRRAERRPRGGGARRLRPRRSPRPRTPPHRGRAEPHTSHTFANLVFSSRSSRGTAAARRCARCTTPGSPR